MRTRHLMIAVTGFMLIVLCAGPVPAQSLEERIGEVRRGAARDRADGGEARRRAGVEAALRTYLAAADFGEELPAREALERLSRVSGVSFLVNWDRLAEFGVDPEQPVRLAGEGLTVRRGLDVVLDQIELFEPLMWEATPWYVHIMTQERANRDARVVVYPVGDLLMRVPQFTNAPAFDLTEVTQGGGEGGGGQGLFEEDEEDDPYMATRYERALRLVDLIRQTIEPDLWRANGGLYGSISIFRDNLIVRAPMYVHRQIGGDVAARVVRRSTAAPAARGNPPTRPAPRESRRPHQYRPAPNAGVIQPLPHGRD